MQVFTVHPSTLPSGIHSGNNAGNYTSGSNMIQSQPINLATNSSAVRRADPFERVDSFRQDFIPPPLSSGRSVNHNHVEQQAQDLSIHSHQKQLDSTDPMNPLLDFCNIILTYTNYPDAFGEDYKPIVEALEGKGKAKSQQARIKMEFETTIQRPPQKRKIGNSTSSTIKQKPGRKPKGAKIVPPIPRLRPEVPTPPHEESGGMNGTRAKLEENRMNNRRRERKVSSPLNSVGESREGTHSSSSSTSSHAEERDSQPSNLFYPDDDRDESWEEVTCFCGKPFAGRPMIECENCFVWHHMSCAKLRKTNVPKKFYCRDCKHMFPDFTQERQRRASGNVVGDSTQYPKTPVKATTMGKNGLSSTTEVITLPLTIPPPLSQDQSESPKSPTSSLYFTPKEGSNLSQFPSVIKSSSSSTATNAQFRNREHPYVNGGGSSESKNVHNSSSSKPSIPSQSPPRKTVEKTKRRPTLNSASSGLYDDVLLPLRLNFSSIGNSSQNGTSSST